MTRHNVGRVFKGDFVEVWTLRQGRTTFVASGDDITMWVPEGCYLALVNGEVRVDLILDRE